MILDNETSFVYLSKQLANRQHFFEGLTGVFNKHKIQFSLLPETKDIWCIDYMPIQKQLDEFIQFKYEPDYLQTDQFISTQTNPNLVCESIGIESHKSVIKIDGGNVIKGKDWVILTDKIFSENKGIKPVELINQLEKLFETKIIIIPREPNEHTGHADGILRYFEKDCVLINQYYKKDKPAFQQKLKTILKSESIQFIEIPFNPYKNASGDEANGLYINYLQMQGFILIPTFGLKEDELAMRQFEKLFPFYVIDSINSREIAKDGGVLNCITWNVKSQFNN